MADIPKQRISFLTAIFMLVTAFIIDCAQFVFAFLLAAGVALDFFFGALGTFTFLGWFWSKGVNYFGGSKAGIKIASILTTAIIEAIPLIDALPGLTMGVATIIWATRKEDAEKIAKAAAETPPDITPSRLMRNPGVDPRYTTAEYYQQGMEDLPEEDGSEEVTKEYESA